MTALFVLLYKMINPKGITAVKLDGYLDPLFFSSDSLSLFKRLKHKVFFRTLRQVVFINGRDLNAYMIGYIRNL